MYYYVQDLKMSQMSQSVPSLMSPAGAPTRAADMQQEDIRTPLTVGTMYCLCIIDLMEFVLKPSGSIGTQNKDFGPKDHNIQGFWAILSLT